MANEKPITIVDLIRVTKEVSREVTKEVVQELVPDMIRRGTDDIRAEVTGQGIRLKIVQTDVRRLKDTVRQQQGSMQELQESHQQLTGSAQHLQGSYQALTGSVQKLQGSYKDLKDSVYRLEVLNEDFDHRMAADAELLRNNLNVRDQVRDHETRLGSVESFQTIVKDTVRDHSRQLKSAG
jgi:chromosome segregation ATPase